MAYVASLTDNLLLGSRFSWDTCGVREKFLFLGLIWGGKRCRVMGVTQRVKRADGRRLVEPHRIFHHEYDI